MSNLRRLGGEVVLGMLSVGIVGGVIFSTTEAVGDPTVPGFTVETYAVLSGPVTLSFDPSGVLYVGHDNRFLPGGSCCSVIPIHRIGVGGTPVEEYGDPTPDPDTVLFDATGAIAPLPGSVLVGGNFVGQPGATISAISRIW